MKQRGVLCAPTGMYRVVKVDPLVNDPEKIRDCGTEGEAHSTCDVLRQMSQGILGPKLCVYDDQGHYLLPPHEKKSVADRFGLTYL